MKADMATHTVTVDFDDEEVSVTDVVTALVGAGYAVPSYEKAD